MSEVDPLAPYGQEADAETQRGGDRDAEDDRQFRGPAPDLG